VLQDRGQIVFGVEQRAEILGGPLPAASVTARDLILTITRDQSGKNYDWPRVMRGLFQVRWAQGDERPPRAHVATQYHGYWFYIDDRDQDTKATFSLLLELSRLELAGKAGPGPVLTIPLGGR